jgi:hypothetical protein
MDFSHPIPAAASSSAYPFPLPSSQLITVLFLVFLIRAIREKLYLFNLQTKTKIAPARIAKFAHFGTLTTYWTFWLR